MGNWGFTRQRWCQLTPTTPGKHSLLSSPCIRPPTHHDQEINQQDTSLIATTVAASVLEFHALSNRTRNDILGTSIDLRSLLSVANGSIYPLKYLGRVPDEGFIVDVKRKMRCCQELRNLPLKRFCCHIW